MATLEEKPLYIILVMYIASFGIVGVQYTLGDPMGVTMVDISGVPLIGGASGTDGVLGASNLDELSESTADIIDLSPANVIADPVGTVANVGWTVFQLMTGTFIFNILILVGVPPIFVAGMVVVYVIMAVFAVTKFLKPT